jgi:pyruvate dehydrogenase E2 component (dihydrolipoamide acetyltransferase)
MPHLLRVPEIAAGTTEAVLATWPVAENSPYWAADVIATVETAKAVIDIEAEENGVILRRLVPEGADVTVGQPIALIGAPGESAENIEDELRAQGITPDTPAGLTPAGPALAPPAEAATANGTAERVFISPIARRLARAADLDLRVIAGTGPNGRIMRRDVERAVRTVTAEVQSAPAAVTPPADYQEIPHNRVRRAIASRLTMSMQTVPHFYVSGTARADKLLRLRAELNEGASGVRISLNDLVIKAVTRAHQLVPAMNVIWTPDAVRSFTSVDVGVAIASPRGLVTPVLRSVDRSGIAAISAAMSDLVERAGSGRLTPPELDGGTITVTNLGMFGTESFAAIINPPQSSILAIGAVHRAPVVKNNKLVVGSILKVTLSVDHRAVDGATAAEWMRAFVAAIQHPAKILL